MEQLSSIWSQQFSVKFLNRYFTSEARMQPLQINGALAVGDFLNQYLHNLKYALNEAQF